MARHQKQAIETKYIPASKSRQSRIRATAYGGSIMVPWDSGIGEEENHHRAARMLAVKMGWEGRLIPGGRPDGKGNVYVFAR